MTLLELLITAVLTALLMLGLVHFASATGASNLLMENQAFLQDQLRVTRRVLAPAIMQAGFKPGPWNDSFSLQALGDGTADDYSRGNDRLVVREWSDRNCFDNLNPAKSPAGQPAFHIRESAFDVSTDRHLTRDCRYGPTLSDLVVQIRRQGLVPGVESFQLLFGEDSSGNGNVDHWVRAQAWEDGESVTGIRVGLLLAGEDPVTEPAAGLFSVLDETITTRADGKLRMAAEFVFAIRGKGR
jgi:hypothetical protein